MELSRYLDILNRRKWMILVTAVVTLVVVAVGTSRMTPIYSASAVARVAGVYGTTASYADLNYGERLRETYVFLLKSRPFLEAVAGRLGQGLGVADLAQAIKVESLPNTELIRVTVDNRDPRQAAAIANMLTCCWSNKGRRCTPARARAHVRYCRSSWPTWRAGSETTGRYWPTSLQSHPTLMRPRMAQQSIWLPGSR